MPYIYPPATPTISGDNITISRFLNNPDLIARRMRTLLEQRYIADVLLSGRYNVVGGAVQYETGEPLFGNDNPQAVAPGSEYPLTSLPSGAVALARTVKWGQDTIVTDEAISRQNMSPVERALVKLANTNVKYIDSVALSAIVSAVAAPSSATAVDWSASGTTAAQILAQVLNAKAAKAALNEGFDLDTVVVSDTDHAFAMAKFVAAGYFGRETDSANPALTGNFPTIAGLRWLPTPNLPVSGEAFLVDTNQLGGMADENLGGPGYVSAGGVGIQVKTMREDEEDRWRLRCRRVTVPVILEPLAATRLDTNSAAS